MVLDLSIYLPRIVRIALYIAALAGARWARLNH